MIAELLLMKILDLVYCFVEKYSDNQLFSLAIFTSTIKIFDKLLFVLFIHLLKLYFHNWTLNIMKCVSNVIYQYKGSLVKNILVYIGL